jgi:hypothetical protein
LSSPPPGCLSSNDDFTNNSSPYYQYAQEQYLREQHMRQFDAHEQRPYKQVQFRAFVAFMSVKLKKIANKFCLFGVAFCCYKCYLKIEAIVIVK